MNIQCAAETRVRRTWTHSHELALYLAHGCDHLVTTAKDWVKLEARLPETAVTVAELVVEWGDNGKTLPQLVEERLMSSSGLAPGA